jgi:LysM repeat protein
MDSTAFSRRRRWLALPLALIVGIAPGAALVGAAPGIHTVRQGETLSEIAEGYGVQVAALAGANALADPDLIVTGSVLTLPGETNTAGAGVATWHKLSRG